MSVYVYVYTCVCVCVIGPSLPQLAKPYMPHRPTTTSLARWGRRETLCQLTAAIGCQMKTFFSSCCPELDVNR